MAQVELLSKRYRIMKLHEVPLGSLRKVPSAPTRLRLYFPAETAAMRTQFRDSVLNYIFRTAMGLSDGHLVSAEVMVSDTPGEVDSLFLDLTLTVDADRNFIRNLRYEILVKLGEWSEEWSEEQKEDYGRRI